ncbi:MAG: 1-acyl-sn-glycerol-3-phosphate acyltransferase [Paludibacteraceae bacterium]|nr:1-acyl-sn-glycerol-3-phosphate acyltransferase [Paludibacteraceae bacterium]
MNKYKQIRAWRVEPMRMVADLLIHWPYLDCIAHKTATSLQLDYAEGQQQQIEQDIRHGAFFMTNHRDIVMDSAWLSMLLEKKYGIRPFIGIGNNLFGKWWIEPFVRLNRAFVVIRDGSPRDLLQHSKTLSEYIQHLRRQGKSIWLAQREGRAKDGNDRTQPAVLKMLTMANTGQIIETIKQLNICPVSISYEYDPCDYLKAQEMQQKRDIEGWKKSKQDDLTSMHTGIHGQKGRVVFRITPSINHWIDSHRDELEQMNKNEQVAAVAAQIDQQIHANYELFERGTEFEQYLQQQYNKINIPNKDKTFLMSKLHEMYQNPVINYEKSHFPGLV